MKYSVTCIFWLVVYAALGAAERNTYSNLADFFNLRGLQQTENQVEVSAASEDLNKEEFDLIRAGQRAESPVPSGVSNPPPEGTRETTPRRETLKVQHSVYDECPGAFISLPFVIHRASALYVERRGVQAVGYPPSFEVLIRSDTALTFSSHTFIQGCVGFGESSKQGSLG